jgi:hypothetical protein
MLSVQVEVVDDRSKVSNPKAYAKFLRIAEAAWMTVRGRICLHVSDWQEWRLEMQEIYLRSCGPPELTKSQARVLAWAINELLDNCTSST